MDHFIGMFAFAIVNTDTGVVTLGRDRLGIKPLYLADTPGRLRFASSVQALLRAGDVDTSIDRVALHHYFSFHAVSRHHTPSTTASASCRPPRS